MNSRFVLGSHEFFTLMVALAAAIRRLNCAAASSTRLLLPVNMALSIHTSTRAGDLNSVGYRDVLAEDGAEVDVFSNRGGWQISALA